MADYLKPVLVTVILALAACTCDSVEPSDTGPPDDTSVPDTAPMDTGPDSPADAGPCGDFAEACCLSEPPCISTFMCCTGPGYPEPGECRDLCAP